MSTESVRNNNVIFWDVDIVVSQILIIYAKSFKFSLFQSFLA